MASIIAFISEGRITGSSLSGSRVIVVIECIYLKNSCIRYTFVVPKGINTQISISAFTPIVVGVVVKADGHTVRQTIIFKVYLQFKAL
ncbi:hypothetical protein [Flintibacter sp. KGMB00164]|uniref:hypothetical protein n=1 Tax=Flintibacter sp. KGMB00164 TaxID=2610895 RepID=UPI00178699BC|nr:hypothetical protein [Flintibacter sp. KGMB00164]